jgi:hypothetical protein
MKLVISVFLAFLSMWGQNTPKDSPKQEMSGPTKTASVSKETEKTIEQLKKKLAKAEEKFQKEKADLEKKITKETKEEAKNRSSKKN